MKTMISICLAVLIATIKGFAAGERTPAGGRSLAMGGTSVASCDFWSAGNNQAGIAWLKATGIGISFENRFLVKELLLEQFGVALPCKPGTFGLFLNRCGNKQYSEIKAGLSFARKFGKHFSAGIQIDYFRIHITDNYGSKNLVSCEIGLLFLADKHLHIGVQLVNPVPFALTENPTEILPASICIGLTYLFSDDFLTSVEADKDLLNPLAFRLGAEYRVARPAFARIGISTSPMSFTFGFGLEFGKLKLDMASGYHQALGFSPSGSITYSFR